MVKLSAVIMGEEFKKPELFLEKTRRLSEWYDLKKEQLREVAEYLKVELTPEMKKGQMVEILVKRVGGEPLDATREQMASAEAQRVTLEQVRVKESAETERELARIALEKEKLRVKLE